MVERFTSVLMLDARVHWKVLLLMVVYTCAFPAYAHFAGSAHKESMLAGLFGFTFLAVPMVVPWWVVGNDRMKGTIWLLVSLPMSRLELALIKCLEVAVLGAAMFYTGAVAMVLSQVVTIADVIPYVSYTPLFFAPVALVSTGLFYLLPSRVAMFVTGGALITLIKLTNSMTPGLQLSSDQRRTS